MEYDEVCTARTLRIVSLLGGDTPAGVVPLPGKATGSAVFIKRDNDISGPLDVGTYWLTNFHVIAGSMALAGQHPEVGEAYFLLQPCGGHEVRDIAVVYMPPLRDTFTARFTEAQQAKVLAWLTRIFKMGPVVDHVNPLRENIIGRTVLACGYALAQWAPSVTRGEVSAIQMQPGTSIGRLLVQITAGINPGSSGGGLWLIDGTTRRFVGVPSMGIPDASVMGYAIRADEAMDIAHAILGQWDHHTFQYVEDHFLDGKWKDGRLVDCPPWSELAPLLNLQIVRVGDDIFDADGTTTFPGLGDVRISAKQYFTAIVSGMYHVITADETNVLFIGYVFNLPIRRRIPGIDSLHVMQFGPLFISELTMQNLEDATLLVNNPALSSIRDSDRSQGRVIVSSVDNIGIIEDPLSLLSKVPVGSLVKSVNEFPVTSLMDISVYADDECEIVFSCGDVLTKYKASLEEIRKLTRALTKHSHIYTTDTLSFISS